MAASRSFFQLIVLLACYSLAPSGAIAQTSGDVRGASDSPWLDRFSGSRIVDFEQQASAYYQLALDRMQRVNGQVVPGSEERIQGALTRITYQVPDGFSGDEVFEFFTDQLRANEAVSLFRCEGRACGSSNYWANDVFENRILYGPETDQFYLAARADDAQSNNSYYVAVYVITRGNRRVYAHLDIVEPAMAQSVEASVTVSALRAGVIERGAAIAPGLQFSDTDELVSESPLETVAQLLRTESLMRLYIVAHLQGEEALQVLLERSQKRADAVVAALGRMGVNLDRLTAQGVGPLSPLCEREDCETRVELVLNPN
ncbi:MAG: DUF4892 domain-containing protein [Pseudohongiellaceae bacterium]|nr:DUF4892 domain-containing protein [Pseudohongiellaceae bacterium]